MKYPILSRTALSDIAAKRVDGAEVDVEPFVEWVGNGPLMNLARVEEVADEARNRFIGWPDSDVDKCEGSLSLALYNALSGVPPEVLDDRGFWRFLSMKYFWDFIAWRQIKSFAPGGNYLKYVDATRNTETVLVRMYIRASALGGHDEGGVASGISKAGDFWRSHIVRVQTGSAPVLATAFASKQMDDRLNTKDIRQVAKRLNRTWTNVIMHVYDAEEARDIVEDVWNVDSSA